MLDLGQSVLRRAMVIVRGWATLQIAQVGEAGRVPLRLVVMMDIL